ncbi:DUF1775 domain-containing protein [Paracoccus sp. P2]|uniref:DUF1775 domain-containing protein n=1 Tax=Paracoccus pantotrophus TaxID=82367 RepID=A0A7H9BQ04_PARPN|nr:DUF1775 domain-containing protein [Paracoccus pantotrophus]QLH13302.1 DUF1775 domain-containing protein [Paracoccus pantotrophus]RDD96466.1 DUF1775 domain-containing protein [Paracoccus pantotrophus]RNI16786.1 DUF1775 domain-containing protein [Paracoccus pantotrophus]WGR67484.1 DUF1775 domain-containing protein [Paracoccus pantotrophus]
MQNPVFGALCATLLGLAAGPALSHATLEKSEAAAGAAYRAVIRIGHGCDGQTTHTLRVELPEGFYNAKPMPKPGWTLETVKGAYARPFDNHGTQMTEGTREVVWSGGALQDDWYDEFVIRGTVGADVAPGTVLYFPTVQECAEGKADWTDVSGSKEVPNPAPGLTVTAGKADHGHGHGHSHGHGHGPDAQAAAAGGPVVLGDLALSGGFSRATPPGAPVAGGFLTIANGGDEDRLVAAHADFAGRTEIHEMAMEGEVMRMRELPDGLAIPAGATVELKPGGYHLMFMELKQPLVEGETVNVTLSFEKAGEVSLPLAVGPRNAGAQKGGGHGGH